jgi:hypothetical protein
MINISKEAKKLLFCKVFKYFAFSKRFEDCPSLHSPAEASRQQLTLQSAAPASKTGEHRGVNGFCTAQTKV